MKKKFFGIELDCSDFPFDPQPIIACLFICLNIYAKHALHILTLIKKKLMTCDEVRKKAEIELKKLKSNADIAEAFKHKLANWTENFGSLQDYDYDFLESEFGITKEALTGSPMFTQPRHFADYIKRYVKGQDRAIDQLSISLFLHYFCEKNKFESEINSSVLLAGPTGSGKSEILRVFSRISGCHVIRINTCEIVPEGWSGLHLSDVLSNEFAAGVSLEKLKYSVLIFNEFDKITHYGSDCVKSSGTDSDLDMQRTIMRLFDKDYCIPLHGFGLNQTEIVAKLPVNNMMILFDGAFSGIEKLISKRLNIGAIGFNKTAKAIDTENIMRNISTADLIEWGYIPELLGRIGNYVVLDKLNITKIAEILSEAENNILAQHRRFCAKNNIVLKIEEDALMFLSEEAYKSNLGFRAAQKLIAKLMQKYYTNVLNEASSKDGKKELTISKKLILESNINAKDI